MIYKMFSVEKLSQAGQKSKTKPQSVGKKSFYWNTSSGFEYKKAA